MRRHFTAAVHANNGEGTNEQASRSEKSKSDLEALAIVTREIARAFDEV